MDRKKLDIAISIIAAIVLWFYVINIENPITNTVIRDVPINMEGTVELQERGYAVSSASAETIDINIQGTRNEVLRVSAADISVRTNVSGLSEGSSSVVISYSVPQGITVTSVETNNVTYNVEKYVTVSKPVEVIMEGTSGSREVTVISTSLSQVDVSGAESLVASVDTVRVNGSLSKAELDQETVNALACKAVDESGKEVAGVTLAHDTINVTAAVYQTKTVPLEVPIKGDVWEGTTLTGTALPESVVIKGPASMLSQTSGVSAKTIDISGIYEDKEFEVVPSLPDGLYLSDSNTALIAKFTVATEGQLIFNYKASDIRIMDVADGLKASVTLGDALDKFSGTVTGPVSLLRPLAAGDVAPTVSVRNRGAGDYDLTMTPLQNISGLKVVFSPATVTITLK